MSELGYVYEQSEGVFKYSRHARPVTIGGVQYPTVFFENGSTAELKAIGVYRVKEFNRVDQNVEDYVSTSTTIDVDDMAIITETGTPNENKRHREEYAYVQEVERSRIEDNVGDNAEVLRVVVVAMNTNGYGDNIYNQAEKRVKWMDETHRYSWTLRNKIKNNEAYDPDAGWPEPTW